MHWKEKMNCIDWLAHAIGTGGNFVLSGDNEVTN